MKYIQLILLCDEWLALKAISEIPYKGGLFYQFLRDISGLTDKDRDKMRIL